MTLSRFKWCGMSGKWEFVRREKVVRTTKCFYYTKHAFIEEKWHRDTLNNLKSSPELERLKHLNTEQ